MEIRLRENNGEHTGSLNVVCGVQLVYGDGNAARFKNRIVESVTVVTDWSYSLYMKLVRNDGCFVYYAGRTDGKRPAKHLHMARIDALSYGMALLATDAENFNA